MKKTYLVHNLSNYDRSFVGHGNLNLWKNRETTYGQWITRTKSTLKIDIAAVVLANRNSSIKILIVRLCLCDLYIVGRP